MRFVWQQEKYRITADLSFKQAHDKDKVKFVMGKTNKAYFVSLYILISSEPTQRWRHNHLLSLIFEYAGPQGLRWSSYSMNMIMGHKPWEHFIIGFINMYSNRPQWHEKASLLQDATVLIDLN